MNITGSAEKTGEWSKDWREGGRDDSKRGKTDSRRVRAEAGAHGGRETDPYQYKYLLEDDEAVTEKKESLDDEMKSYEEYDEQLEALLAEVMGNGGVIAWQMN